LGFKATAGLGGFRNVYQTTQDFHFKEVWQVHGRGALSPVRYTRKKRRYYFEYKNKVDNFDKMILR
jgi:hypothetical protein